MKLRNTLAVAGVVALGLAAASAANAASYTDGSLTANFSFAQNYGGTIETFNELTPSSVNGSGYNSGATGGPYSVFGGVGTLSLNGAQIVNGSASGEYAAPNPFVPTTSNYVSVYGGGSATFSLTQGASAFALEWGSVDPSNSLSFYGKNGNLLGTVTGTNIVATLAGVNTTGGPGSGTNWNPGGTIYANIVSSAPIFSVVIGSGQNSFELGPAAISAVPLPAALPLFAAALAGIGGLGWVGKRKTRA